MERYIAKWVTRSSSVRGVVYWYSFSNPRTKYIHYSISFVINVLSRQQQLLARQSMARREPINLQYTTHIFEMEGNWWVPTTRRKSGLVKEFVVGGI